MSDSQRKRWQRAQIPAELQRRGLEADECKLARLPYWRDDPQADHQCDYIIPHEFIARLRWSGGWAFTRDHLLAHLRARVVLP